MLNTITVIIKSKRHATQINDVNATQHELMAYKTRAQHKNKYWTRSVCRTTPHRDNMLAQVGAIK